MKTNALFLFFVLSGLIYLGCNQEKSNKDMIAGKPDSATMAEMKKPVLKYDDRGNIIERKDVMFTPNKRIGNRNFYTYKFDEKNNRIQEVSMTYDTTNRRIMKTVCDFTYNEYVSVRLEEMDVGDKYPLYVYINTNAVWSKHRRGFVVCI